MPALKCTVMVSPCAVFSSGVFPAFGTDLYSFRALPMESRLSISSLVKNTSIREPVSRLVSPFDCAFMP